MSARRWTRKSAACKPTLSAAGRECTAQGGPRLARADGPRQDRESLPKSDLLKKDEPKVTEGERKIEIPLPSDRDMDRMMSFLERAWRRLIEMANRVQRDVNGRI